MSNWNTDALLLIDKFKFFVENYFNSNLYFWWSLKSCFFFNIKEDINFSYLFNLKLEIEEYIKINNDWLSGLYNLKSQT
jgi:hypothetical protein